jgi:4-hydroxythreonine-4-phosphate dehydrogenase
MQLSALQLATAAVRGGAARALVTGPISKQAVMLGWPEQKFVGQTEWLARADGLADDAVSMLFLGPRLRVALVTTHLAIAAAPAAITASRVARACVHLGEALVRLGVSGAVHVAGLNPHAGEGGLFGDEEPRAITPGIVDARGREPYASGRLALIGPRPAEAVFREAAAGTIAGVVAMLHDQATIASKLLDWGDAVNVTWGLSFVRTSVDHGVAYDAAARGDASAEGMIAAVELARRLVPV